MKLTEYIIIKKGVKEIPEEIKKTFEGKDFQIIDFETHLKNWDLVETEYKLVDFDVENDFDIFKRKFH